MDQFPTATIDIGDTSTRQIEWNAASKTITGTIQWTGQASKAITGAIAYRDTLNGRHFYTWAYNAADRPADGAVGVISLTDSTTSVSIPVTFTTVALNAATAATQATAAALNVSKVPRCLDPVPAGGPVTEEWTVVTDTLGVLTSTKVVS